MTSPFELSSGFTLIDNLLITMDWFKVIFTIVASCILNGAGLYS